MIEVKDLTKTFGDKTVLDNINMVFETGKTQPHYRTKRLWQNGIDEKPCRFVDSYQRAGSL